jgi:hypothetical protein
VKPEERKLYHFNVELDWHVWALPLCIMCHYGQTVIRIGPICILWWDHDLSEQQ